MVLLILAVGAVAFALAYRTYGRYLVRLFGMDDAAPTPAHSEGDGRDYHPAKRAVLFGHHFSSIAGAGPIVGPIFATLVFGWLPAVLWIILGSIFIGGVHDFGSLAISVKHRARSIAEVARGTLSPLASKLLSCFIWLALVYVLAVFLDLTAATFAPRLPAALPADKAAALVARGGGVASASLIFMVLAVALGLLTQRGKLGLGAATAIFVPLLFAGVFVGKALPLSATMVPAINGSAATTWSLLLIVYCFIASVTPVWILLQPRDYLSSFLLYACLGGGLVGIALSAFSSAPGTTLAYPAFLGFHADKLGYLFPALFITIACGACSGFHSVVASGTTSKQLDRERDARAIGYGSMLVEGLLALVAVATVAVLAKGAPETRLAPPALFATGLGRFLALLGVPADVGASFGLLALSTFLLTTLDTATRLGRYVLEELLFGHREGGKASGGAALWLTTAATLAMPCVFALITFRDAAGKAIPAWRVIWPVFGTTNQLLGALALMVLSVWLRRSGRNVWVALAPMLLMVAATLVSLVQLCARHGFSLVGIIAGVLLFLALVLLAEAARCLLLPARASEARTS
ncbi:MAG: carbon starvation protein A [Myxococcales bacterium]|nr:carbon starvation protein A [Myxococcales bacterium]